MELLTFNAAVSRMVRKDGRDFLVAPMTIIVPGVLAGSKGPLFYSPEECARNVSEWDSVPITLYHPTDIAGFPVSASHPNAKQIGHLRNSKFDGKLKTEGWFDVEKTRNLAPLVLQSLESNKQVELSTGLYTTNTPKAGVYKGRMYSHTVSEMRPDHLAILPDQVGACSLNDGCGVLVNAQDRDAQGRFMAASGAAREQTTKAFAVSRDAKASNEDKAKAHEKAAEMHGSLAFHPGGGQVARGNHIAQAEKHAKLAKSYRNAKKSISQSIVEDQLKAHGGDKVKAAAAIKATLESMSNDNAHKWHWQKAHEQLTQNKKGCGDGG